VNYSLLELLRYSEQSALVLAETRNAIYTVCLRSIKWLSRQFLDEIPAGPLLKEYGRFLAAADTSPLQALPLVHLLWLDGEMQQRFQMAQTRGLESEELSAEFFLNRLEVYRSPDWKQPSFEEFLELRHSRERPEIVLSYVSHDLRCRRWDELEALTATGVADYLLVHVSLLQASAARTRLEEFSRMLVVERPTMVVLTEASEANILALLREVNERGPSRGSVLDRLSQFLQLRFCQKNIRFVAIASRAQLKDLRGVLGTATEAAVQAHQRVTDIQHTLSF
jgi:hypothetical protein